MMRSVAEESAITLIEEARKAAYETCGLFTQRWQQEVFEQIRQLRQLDRSTMVTWPRDVGRSVYIPRQGTWKREALRRIDQLQQEAHRQGTWKPKRATHPLLELDAQLRKEAGMKLYRVLFDGQWLYVEARSFLGAMVAWKDWARQEWGTDFTGLEEPESVELVHDGPVYRSEST